MLKAIAEFLAGIGAILRYRYDPKQVAKREKEAVDAKIEAAQKAVYEGNEAKVNEIIARTAKTVVVLSVVWFTAGCRSPVTYVDDSDRTIRMVLDGKPGYWVPDHVMADLLKDREKLKALRDAGVHGAKIETDGKRFWSIAHNILEIPESFWKIDGTTSLHYPNPIIRVMDGGWHQDYINQTVAQEANR